MEPKKYNKVATDFTAVIKELSRKSQNLDNLEAYLATHFAVWMERYASTPEDLVDELQMFANMNIGDDRKRDKRKDHRWRQGSEKYKIGGNAAHR